MWQEYYQYYKQKYIFIQKTTFQVKPQQTRVYLYKYCYINTSYKILTFSKFMYKFNS